MNANESQNEERKIKRKRGKHWTNSKASHHIEPNSIQIQVKRRTEFNEDMMMAKITNTGRKPKQTNMLCAMHDVENGRDDF